MYSSPFSHPLALLLLPLLLFISYAPKVSATPTPTAPGLQLRSESPGFITSGCGTDWILGFGGYPQFIAASCPDGSSGGEVQRRASFINLMDCVTNDEGRLLGAKNGAAMRTCTGCFREGPSSITCSCRRTYATAVNSTLDLDTVIKNTDGILSCFDYLGVEVKSLNNPPL